MKLHRHRAIGTPLTAQIAARRKQGVTAGVEGMGEALKVVLYTLVGDL